MELNPEYLAQQFRDCLSLKGLYSANSSDLKRQYAAGWRTEQHGSKVIFDFNGSKYEVSFEAGNKPTARCLELIAEGESTKELLVADLTPILNITQKGKISPPSMIGFFERDVIGAIRKYKPSKQQ